MPGIGSQETHPIAALQDIGEFGVMGEFRFQAGIALFIQIIVVNGDKRVQVPVLRTYNPFAVQKESWCISFHWDCICRKGKIWV